MLSRLSSSALPMRAVARRVASPTAAYSKSPTGARLDSQITNFVTLASTTKGPNAQVKSSPTLHPAKSFGSQTSAASTSTSTPPRSMEVLAKPSEGNSKLEDLSKTVPFGEEMSEGKTVCAYEMAGEEFWLERFGGPGKGLERVAGGGTVVLREEGFLRVLI